MQKSARQETNTLKKCLRYIRIIKDEKPSNEASKEILYSVPFNLSFYDNWFYQNRETKRLINVQTQAEKLHFLPVLVRPEIIKGETRSDFQKALRKTAGLMIQIMPANIKPSNTFEFLVYKFTAAILFLLGLSALCQKLSKTRQLAIPLVRVHKTDANDSIEEYLNSVSAAVIFLLNEQYYAGMQGIQLINLNSNEQRQVKYKITNARNSLYGFLPKRFTAPGFAPAFKKFAIVIATSRVASKHRTEDDDYSLVNLFGRVVLFERIDAETIELNRNFLTFAENLYKREIKIRPQKLIDLVHKLYDEHEIRDLLYIAKAPFTSNLNLTQKDSQKELFFMSETILAEMRQNRADLNIYPAFCEKYPARMFGGTKLNAIYIDDVPSIQKHVQMDSERKSQIVTFLNIANGIQVKGKGAHQKNFFNNIMSYATLDNIYKERVLQSGIMERMIAPNSPEHQTLIDFICLLHAAAYEQVSKEFTLKLNPYQDILETENVNKLNTFSAFSSEKPKFNLFAFLTKIQRIISLITVR